MDQIDAGGGRQSLLTGLSAALPDMAKAHHAALAVVLSAAFDRAALVVAEGAAPEPYIDAMVRLMEGIAD